MGETNFSAKEPSLGYYHQLRLGLFLLLDSSKANPTIKIESLDDIVISDMDEMDLYQTKLHIKSSANLTNASPDFWKTIRVWCENISNDLADPENTLFTLMTTEQIGEGSFINDLKPSITRIRDAYDIQIKMLNVIKTSRNDTNAAGYAAFEKLSAENQLSLINNISVVDNSLSIDDVMTSIQMKLRLSVPPKKLSSLIERLEGWWFQMCILHLQDRIEQISFSELQNKITSILDTLKEDNLPDDFCNPIEIDEDQVADYQDRVFVSQLKLIAVKSNVLKNAINNFHRAFMQRSKWLREELTNIEEEDAFEKKLQDHWTNIFSLMRDECEGMDEENMKMVGYNFYKKYYIEHIPAVKIRERFDSEYLTRGSCHMLSDSKKIGWHPNFDNLL